MSADRRQQFTELFVRHERRLFGYVIALLPNFQEAEEAYQETCLRVWSKWDEFDLGRDFLAWTCGFARNVVRELRQKKRHGAAALSEQMMESIAEVRFRWAASVEAWQSRLADCLEELSPTQRELIVRYYSDETSTDSIAEEVHATPAALYMRLSRIRRLLFDCLKRSIDAEGKP